jgi:adenylate cyclase class IV
MPKEYEQAFYNFNKEDILSKIKNINGNYQGTYLFRVQVLIHPFEKPGTYIRVRDEGFRITMTYKYQGPKDKFQDEKEVIIDNFDMGVEILLGIGCKKKYYYEKIREIWVAKNTEIVFDTNPGITDRLEVESKTIKELNEMLKFFELEKEEFQTKYKELFGIEIPKNMNLDFKTVKKNLIKYVKINKKDFIDLVHLQFRKYKKLMKK